MEKHSLIQVACAMIIVVCSWVIFPVNSQTKANTRKAVNNTVQTVDQEACQDCIWIGWSFYYDCDPVPCPE